MTSNYYVLLLTRFCFGAGEAGAFPNIGISVSRWFPVIERARAMGIVLMFMQLGGALAPLIIVPIQVRYGWRASFYVLGAVGVVWCIAWYRWYRDTPAEKAKVTPAEIEEIGVRSYAGNHHLPWSIALRSANLRALSLLVFCYVYALYFLSPGCTPFWSGGGALAKAICCFRLPPYCSERLAMCAVVS